MPISVHFVRDADQDQNGFDMEVISLAGPQTNEGHYLRHNDYSFEEGTYPLIWTCQQIPMNCSSMSIPVIITLMSRAKIARLINQSDIGLLAEVKLNRRGESAYQHPVQTNRTFRR